MIPLISIVTISFNSQDYIADTIASVANQNYPNIEYIIVDGASTDSTAQIIMSYGNVVSKFISEPDKGIYDAMNKGISMAQGEWIIFLNSGDVLHCQNVISEFVNHMSLHGKETVYLGSVQTIISDREGKIVTPRDEVSPWYTPPHQGSFFPTRLLKENKFDLSFKILGDRELYVRLMKKYNITPMLLPFIVANYDLGGISSDCSKSMKIFFEAKKIHEIHGGKGMFNAYCRAVLKYLLSKFISSETLTKLRYS